MKRIVFFVVFTLAQLICRAQNVGINATIGPEDYDGVCPPGATRLTDCDCANKNFVYAPSRKIKSASDYTNVKYIDPTSAVTPKTGSISTPYTAWSDVTVAPHTAYLLKKGTTLTISTAISIGQLDVLLGSYGASGNKPKIVGTTNNNVILITSDSCTIRDLELRNPVTLNNNVRSSLSNIKLRGTGNNTDIFNCDLITGDFGIGSEDGNHKVDRIINCLIDSMFTEGVFSLANDFLDIGFTTIRNINLAYHVNPSTDWTGSNTGATGDGVEHYDYGGTSAGWKEQWIHNTTIDRGSTGNKAGIMMHNNTANHIKDITEFCTLISPMNNDIAGQSSQTMNIGGTGESVISNNIFIGSPNDDNTMGLYDGGGSDSIIGNVFVNFLQAIQGARNSIVTNNTFYDNDNCVYWTVGSIAELKNNIFYNNRHELMGGITAASESNNLYTNPDFTNAANNDFTLQSTSVAINTGTFLSYRKYDINGTSVPQGATDIGAYEYVSGFPTSSLVPNKGQAFLPVISPNPFRHELRISNTEHVTRAELINMSGKTLVVKQNPQAPEMNIDTKNMKSGVYILRLFDNTGAISVFKVMK